MFMITAWLWLPNANDYHMLMIATEWLW